MRLSVLFCLILSLAAFAEEGKGSLYIVKVNGDTVYGSGTVKERIFAADMLYINGDSLKISDVAVLKNEYGYFRHPLAGFGDEKLALRTFDGKIIDKYTLEETGFSGPNVAQAGISGPNAPMMMSTWRVTLYSKNDGDLKGIDYANVKADLWDNPGSRAMIETYEFKRRLQWWAWGGLAAAMVSAPLVGDSREMRATVGFTALASLITALYNVSTKQKYLYKAVERYSE